MVLPLMYVPLLLPRSLCLAAVQESGLAIYYRPQTKNDTDGEGGEFLVSKA